MNKTLEASKPLFLSLISNLNLTDEEQCTLAQVRENFADYISDIQVSDGEDPLYYIYIKYCQELIAEIEDSQTAEETSDFINELYEHCNDKEFAVNFETFADEALGLFNSHHIDEFYDTLVESYEEENFKVIEHYINSLAEMYIEDPKDINVLAQSNILHIMLAKWGFSKNARNVSLHEHTITVFIVNEHFAALMKYPHLSDKVIGELQDVWHGWFVSEYVAKFFIPLLDSKYKADNLKKANAFLELELNHTADSGDEDCYINFLNLTQELLISYADTCIPSSCSENKITHTQVNVHKREKNYSPNFPINFGKHDLAELSITFIIELLKITRDSREILLSKLEALLLDIAPIASKEWLTTYHRIFSNFAMNHVSDANINIRGIYIQMVQFLEHCYYKNTNGKSIPPPPVILSRSIEEKMPSADNNTQASSKPSLKLT